MPHFAITVGRKIDSSSMRADYRAKRFLHARRRAADDDERFRRRKSRLSTVSPRRWTADAFSAISLFAATASFSKLFALELRT